MRRGAIFTLGILFCLATHAQQFKEFEVKTFNWGAKVGFNSSFPIVNSFSVDNVEVDNIKAEYKVGYMASIFCRVNVERFFIQPGVSWHSTESKLTYDLPTNPGNLPNANPFLEHEGLVLKTKSIDLPILIGYNLVKEGPYGLSILFGPKIKYNYKTSYSSIFTEDKREYTNDSTPFGIDFVSGVSVTVWRLFFDFCYEFGINEIESDFREVVYTKAAEADIRIDKRTNMMSFSLGILF